MDHRRRSVRPRADNDPGHAHELTFSCFRRWPLLSQRRTCAWLAESVRSACGRHEYDLWADVFMPDHVHLIVCPRRRLYDIGSFRKDIKEPVSRAAMRFLKSNAPDWLERLAVTRGDRVEHHFWQVGPGYDRNILRGQSLLKMMHYVHANPVRKRFVERAEEWTWSSAGWWAGCPQNDLPPDGIPPEWLKAAGEP